MIDTFTSRMIIFSLKYLLDQRVSTPFQSKWLPKLLGFVYEISYKKGSENAAADALSRVMSYGELFSLLSTVSSDLMLQVEHSWTIDKYMQELIAKLQADPAMVSKYTWSNDQLRRKGKVVVGADFALRNQLIHHFHASVGHLGVLVTQKKLATVFYWKGMTKMVKQWIRECDICQRSNLN